MDDKIRISKDAGPIVFLGSMNAMPMMYALELKRKGYEVLYFVDKPRDNILNRPENHYKDIEYPYPDWILEYILASQILLSIFPGWYAKRIERLVRHTSEKDPQAYVLNGFFISLSPYLNSRAAKISVPHGSDLDSWADVEGSANLASSFKKKSIFRFMPGWMSSSLIHSLVKRQYRGLTSCLKILYFPLGLNQQGDRVIKSLMSEGIGYLPRYDMAVESLKDEPRGIRDNRDGKLIIFSGVRFHYQTFNEGNDGYNKGNDVIIAGLAKFYEKFTNIEVHFVEKGGDVAAAKQLCARLGLSQVVVWHQEMKFLDLLKLYEQSDICFDQVGDHWISGIGHYAMLLGKPLIANDKSLVASGIWPQYNPVCSADSPESVCAQLERLVPYEVRQQVSIELMAFAEEYLSPKHTLQKLFHENRP